MSLPSYHEFLASMLGGDTYVNHPEFVALRIKKTPVLIKLEGDNTQFRCVKVITIANMRSLQPRTGSFRRLLDDLIERGFAVYVEGVKDEGFGTKLLDLGFIRVNSRPDGKTTNYLTNYDGNLRVVGKAGAAD